VIFWGEKTVYINISYSLKCTKITVWAFQVMIIYEKESCPNQSCCSWYACYITTSASSNQLSAFCNEMLCMYGNAWSSHYQWEKSRCELGEEISRRSNNHNNVNSSKNYKHILLIWLKFNNQSFLKKNAVFWLMFQVQIIQAAMERGKKLFSSYRASFQKSMHQQKTMYFYGSQ
jgi:hypothetical protein